MPVCLVLDLTRVSLASSLACVLLLLLLLLQGAEHAIHHIVVAQPFYLRHMVRHAAWEAMARHGVRVNDFGSFFRNNRWLALGGPEDKATAFVAAEKAAKLQKKAQQQPGATVAADGAAASSAKKAM